MKDKPNWYKNQKRSRIASAQDGKPEQDPDRKNARESLESTFVLPNKHVDPRHDKKRKKGFHSHPDREKKYQRIDRIDDARNYRGRSVVPNEKDQFVEDKAPRQIEDDVHQTGREKALVRNKVIDD